jgi:uncharacterized damage-inducible protein DinB
MSIAQQLLDEFEVQAPVTRKFLERLPEEKLNWRPHLRSMTAGQLAYHLAVVPGGVAKGSQPDVVPAPDFVFPQPASKQEILDTFDESVATVREVLGGYDDARLNAMWRVKAGDEEVLAVPRVWFLRNIMLNHWYQHRGQFSVYLRMLDVPVPSSWGPSADERSATQREAVEV